MGCVRPRSITGYPEMNCEARTSEGVFPFFLRRNQRARALTLRVHPGGAISATAPLRMPLSAIEKFFEARAKWILRTRAFFALQPIPIVLSSATNAERAALHNKLSTLVRRAAEGIGISPSLFSIKTMRSRFGSCSARRTISLSDSLRALPDELVWYVVAHEVAHCKELNHSPVFWALVARLVPDWRACRCALKKYCFA